MTQGKVGLLSLPCLQAFQLKCLTSPRGVYYSGTSSARHRWAFFCHIAYCALSLAEPHNLLKQDALAHIWPYYLPYAFLPQPLILHSSHTSAARPCGAEMKLWQLPSRVDLETVALAARSPVPFSLDLWVEVRIVK